MTLYLDNSATSRVLKFLVLYMENKDLSIEYYNGNISLELENFTASGLSNIIRQVVKHTIRWCTANEYECQQKEFLLGYKQNCLKACAEVSCWTKFCEREFPAAVARLLKLFQSDSDQREIPEPFIKIEKELNAPKKTPNVMKYFNSKKKKIMKSKEFITNTSNVTYKSIDDLLNDLEVTSHCCLYKLKDSQINYTREIDDWLVNVKSKNDIKWPYLCALSMTITDLIVLGFLFEVIESIVPCRAAVHKLFSELPNIKEWLLRCTSQDNVVKSACSVWNFKQKNRCRFGNDQFVIFPDSLHVTHVSLEVKSMKPKHIHSQIEKNVPRILDNLSLNNILPTFGETHELPATINWSSLPTEVDPVEGELNPSRASRKRQQVENMIHHLLSVLKEGQKVVDFCAGGGHLGIVIAYLRRDCHVTLLENKEESIERALTRINKIGLTNIDVYMANLGYYNGDFDVGVSLHACGSATDLVLAKCIRQKASFVICPCCYGSIRPTDSITYPKSQKFSHMNAVDYFLLAHSADQTSSDFDSEYSRKGKHTMCLIDYDRAAHSEEVGPYHTTIHTMEPKTCSPKNNVIVGKSCSI